MEYQPETLDIYQEDEKERSAALVNYVSAGYPILTASDVLGIELTEEQRAALEAEVLAKEKRREEMEKLSQQKPKEEESIRPAFDAYAEKFNKPLQDELDKWQRKATNALKRGKSPAVEFESDLIDDNLEARILNKLEAVKDVEDIRAVFSDIESNDRDDTLTLELKRANDLLERKQRRLEPVGN